MNKKISFMKKIVTLVLSMVLMVSSFTVTASACTSVFAGKDATADGSVLIARNEDMSSAWAKHFKVFPRVEHKTGETLAFYNGLVVPQPEVSYKYMALPDWDDSEGPFQEAGINEFGVAISATNSAGTTEQAQAADPFVENGIGETHIPTLVLPRAKTAKEGVQLLGAYIEQYGATEGNGLAIADKNEVWYMEIGSGHHWVAIRVPDDKYIVVANQLRIDAVDFTNTEHYLFSTNLEKFVYDNALLQKEETFDFAKAFGTLGSTRNTRREWWGQHLLTPSLQQGAEETRYPLFLTPDEKLTVKDVMSVLRSKYEGTAYSPDTEIGKSERTIGVDSTMESHVIQLRQNMPKELSGLMWLSFGNPEYSVYIPYYAGITDTPAPYKVGSDTYDTESAYWAFRGAAALAETDKMKLGEGLKNYWDQYENDLIARQTVLDQMFMELFKTDKEKAIELLTLVNKNTALDAIEKAQKLQKMLITEIAEQSKKPFNPEF